jgi:hypothetical protein
LLTGQPEEAASGQRRLRLGLSIVADERAAETESCGAKEPIYLHANTWHSYSISTILSIRSHVSATAV